MIKQVTALFLAVLMSATLVGCSGGGSAPSSNYSNERFGGASPYPQQQRNQGMSTKQKMVLLAGAAALAYMYNKHKNKQGHGPEGQYYRSKNGRIYYRDKQGRAHWVSPPRNVYVPQDQAEMYQRQAPNFRY